MKLVCYAALIPAAMVTSALLSADLPQRGSTAKSDYQEHCASCHGNDFEGRFGPPLVGEEFKEKWASASAAELFTYIKTSMPPTNPGGLSDGSYTGLTNLLVETNAIAPLLSGHTPLGKDQSAPQAVLAPPKLPPAQPRMDATYQSVMDHRKGLLQKITPITDDMLVAPAPGEWAVWRRTPDTLGYSPLDQIGRGNVAQLKLAWSKSLMPGTNGIAPLVHDGVMFFNASGKVMALDATNGDLLWEYHGSETPSAVVSITQPRGIALYGDRVYVPATDGRMIALDIRTGKPVWEKLIFKPEDGLQITAAPLAIRGKIIQGVAGCYNEIHRGGCFVVALDARTGDEKWRFNTIARGNQPGADSWNGAPLEERYGASVWSTASYDAKLNLLFVGTSQTYKMSTLLMPNPRLGKSKDALFTNSTLALDPESGKLIWYFQHLPGDVWDMDYAFERSLITLNSSHGPHRIVVTGGKDGIFDALDAKTGKYLSSHDMGIQTLVKAIDPKTGRKEINPAARYDTTSRAMICPYVGGGRNWPATSYDPVSHLLFIPMVETCMDMWLAAKSSEFKGARQLKARPDSDGKFGRVAALDLSKNQIVWTNRRRAPQSSAMLATAGGLVFEGGRDKSFRALNSATGETLWETALSDPPNSFPISYAVDGVQYVAVVLGGNTPHDVIFRSLTPEIENSNGSRSVLVFKLPEH